MSFSSKFIRGILLPTRKRKLDSFLSNTYSTTMQPTINLNRRELQLRRLLLDVSSSLNAEGGTEPLVLRWAGGWVRDKILGVETHDIDVAINAMTGVDFAQRMCEYCSTPEVIAKHAIKPDDIGNLHNVARNPDKSKHLETAMLKIFGLDIDLVNLRKEKYAEDSRNPEIEFGTAEEDALRRDATINALFYNIHTNEIEDFTGGLPDLDGKIIRTPLNPLKTFTDDPLRVLRLVRFASRLEFSIEEATRDVMSHCQVLHALKVKISRERVGTELEKMLRGNHPRDALELIDKLHLYNAIFTDPTRAHTAEPETSRWYVAYDCLDDIIQNRSPGSVGQLLIRSEDGEYVSWNLAAVSPWMTMDYAEDYELKANTPPIVSIIAREGYKAPNKLSDIFSASYKNRAEILDLKAAVCGKDSKIFSRDVLGMAIRRWDAHGGPWTLQVLNAMLVQAMDQLDRWPKPGNSDRDSFLSGWQQFLDHIVDMDVFDAPTMKRLLDGRSLAQALGIKPGKWTGQALDICMEWQLRNPQESDPSGAIEEVRSRRDELGIP